MPRPGPEPHNIGGVDCSGRSTRRSLQRALLPRIFPCLYDLSHTPRNHFRVPENSRLEHVERRLRGEEHEASAHANGYADNSARNFDDKTLIHHRTFAYFAILTCRRDVEPNRQVDAAEKCEKPITQRPRILRRLAAQLGRCGSDGTCREDRATRSYDPRLVRTGPPP